MKNRVIGIDFGTLSVRAIVADMDSGQILGEAEAAYPHAVMNHLNGTALPRDFALQDPQDYLDCLCLSVTGAVSRAGIEPETVIGMGLDFTSSTPLPVDAELKPLCFYEENRDKPHAFVKLWKHHGASAQAQRLLLAAKEESCPWLEQSGGGIRSEGFIPKLMEFAECAPELYRQCAFFIESGDWVTSLLTGKLSRSLSNAECNSSYIRNIGYPSDTFMLKVCPAAVDYKAKLAGEMIGIGEKAGELCPEFAALLGLPQGIAVCSAGVDSHSSVPASGANESGDLVIVFGTSACHLLLGTESRGIPGIYCAAPDAHIPGCWGFEAGQSGVGDSFSAFCSNYISREYELKAAQAGMSIQQYLTEKASALRVGESGLLALDWFNGVRSPLMDTDLSGVLVGLKLDTKPEEIYRALLESSAMGTRRIIDCYEKGGQTIRRVFAAGGIPKKNPLFMQICADICEREIIVCDCPQACALGSAVFAATASGMYSFDQASAQLKAPELCRYQPENALAYRRMYDCYLKMSDFFASQKSVMYEMNAYRCSDKV